MIARTTIRAYALRRQTVSTYVVEYKGGHAHRNGECREVCEREAKTAGRLALKILELP
jgi:hypothetical protein